MKNGDPSRLESETDLTENEKIPYYIKDIYETILESYNINRRNNVATKIREKYDEFVDNSARIKLFESLKQINILKSFADRAATNLKVLVATEIIKESLGFAPKYIADEDYKHIAKAYVAEFSNVADLFDTTLDILYWNRGCNQDDLKPECLNYLTNKVKQHNPDEVIIEESTAISLTTNTSTLVQAQSEDE